MALALGALTSAGWCGLNVWQRAAHLPIDATLEQRALPSPEQLEAFVYSVAQADAEKSVYLNAQGELLSVPLSQLGVKLDVESTLEQARRAPALGGLWERLHRVWAGPPVKPHVVDPVFVFDSIVAGRTLERVARTVNRQAIDAALDYPHHRRIEDQAGRELDIASTLMGIGQARWDEGDLVQLQFRAIPARVSSLELPAVDVSHVLSEYETSFDHHGGPRAVNIRRGAQLLDGFILAPHATFSFNHVVGSRTESRGFIDAPVIINDEMDKGVGGGICQVASTLHAAALFGGLKITERRSHSRPSAYAPLGLDATVVDGEVDLRFANPYDAPLLIHVFLPSSTTVRVELLGLESQVKVEHTPQLTKRSPFVRRVVEKPELPAGEIKRSQKGSYGYDVISVVRYTDRGGAVTTRQYKSKYFPVPEVFWVSPGTPADALPPLPEGAEGVESPL